MHRSKPVLTMVLLGAACFACASGGAVPSDKLARSEASVRAAHELGAESSPQAALHIRLAREQIDQAKRLIKDGENDRAAMLLGRAEADAEVATNLTRESAAVSEAQRSIA